MLFLNLSFNLIVLSEKLDTVQVEDSRRWSSQSNAIITWGGDTVPELLRITAMHTCVHAHAHGRGVNNSSCVSTCRILELARHMSTINTSYVRRNDALIRQVVFFYQSICFQISWCEIWIYCVFLFFMHIHFVWLDCDTFGMEFLKGSCANLIGNR